MIRFGDLYDDWIASIDKIADPRVKDWGMMSSPLPTVIILVIYIFVVKYLGPKMMENREPFQLREVLIVYNFFQVIINVILFHKTSSFWLGSYSWRCEPLDQSPTGDPMAMAHYCWYILILKFIELFDTILFILRKNFRQITALHILHHGLVPFSVWWGVKLSPGGHGSFFPFLNLFVHIIMYSYYMLSALGPQVRHYLWWKKYLTLIQMIQFVLVFFHAAQLYISNKCNYPIYLTNVNIFHSTFYFVLFLGFYRNAYVKKEKLKV